MCSCDGSFPGSPLELVIWLVLFNLAVQAIGTVLLLAVMYYWTRNDLIDDEPPVSHR